MTNTVCALTMYLQKLCTSKYSRYTQISSVYRVTCVYGSNVDGEYGCHSNLHRGSVY